MPSQRKGFGLLFEMGKQAAGKALQPLRSWEPCFAEDLSGGC